MFKSPVIGAVVLGLALAGLGVGAWVVRGPSPETRAPAARGLEPAPIAPEVRVEPLPPTPAADRDRLLVDAKNDSATARMDSGRGMGRLLDRTNDAELLASLHALAKRDSSTDVRAAVLGELVFRNDRVSFEILVDAAKEPSEPTPVRLRAIELLERAARPDYGMFLANHGTAGRESDRIAAQRRDRAKAALVAADQVNRDPEIRAALQKALAKYN